MNEALKLPAITDDTDYASLKIGNSVFTDDVWDLSPYIESKSMVGAYKKIRFEYIKSEDMRFVVKQYAYYLMGQLRPRTIKSKINGTLPVFIEYCELNNIASFYDVTKETALTFAEWIKNTKDYQSKFKYQCSQILEEIIKLGQIKGWNVADGNVFIGINSYDIWNARTLRTNNKIQPIPQDVFDKIMYYAINKETNIITKTGIIIQSQTGLRISEVLSIQEDCLSYGGNNTPFMEVAISKTVKGDVIKHRVPVNDLVVSAIEELSKVSESYRKKLNCKDLFISKTYGGSYPKVNFWTSYRLANFIKKWDIRGADGYLYPLKSHQFRATFVRELIKRKIPLAYIMKQFAHVSIDMTAYYLTLENDEIREIYTDMIFGEDSKIAGLRANEIKGILNKEFKGKTPEEIKGFVEELSRTMSFNPLPTGVCLYDFMRGNCTDGDGCFFYDCPNYLTEAKFYPILKKELELMDIEMDRLKALGRERDWQRQFIKHKYLKPLVESLEVQINEQ